MKAAEYRPGTQIDVETGSVLSGIYDTESTPSLLELPQGWWLLYREIEALLKPFKELICSRDPETLPVATHKLKSFTTGKLLALARSVLQMEPTRLSQPQKSIPQ